MPDFLTTYAEVQPDKLAVIDDRPDGTIIRWTFAELDEQANRLANVLVGPRRRSRAARSCGAGRTRPSIVAMVNAARKIGVTAVPLNYRLSAEEAAYVTDHCDATIVFVDAEFAPLFERIRNEIPKVEHILVFDGSVPDRHARRRRRSWRTPPTDEPPVPETTEPGATMIYTSGTTGKPKGAFRKGVGDPAQVIAMMQLIGYTPDDVYLTTGPLYHSGPGRVHGARAGPRPDRRRAAQVRPRGLAAPRRHVQGHVHLLGADARSG